MFPANDAGVSDIGEARHETAYGPHDGGSTLVFDPFSQEFFDDPYEFYRWMRAEASPVLYSDQY